jgi:hypothetical protein
MNDPRDRPDAEAEIEAYSAERLRRVIIAELRGAVGAGDTQETLALKLGYSSAAQLNKILRGHANLPVDKARILDSLGYVTESGATFSFLAQRHAEVRARNRSSTSKTFDLFLALPMAATASDEEFAHVKDTATRMVDALENNCDYTVYCAALGVVGRRDFDSSAFAMADNVAALRNSERFALWLPGPLTKSSSVWVEAGMALALQLHCTFLVPNLDVLPYILTEARHSPMHGFGTVSFHLTNGVDPVALIRRHRGRLFER